MLPEKISRAELVHMSEEASAFIRDKLGMTPSIAVQTGSGITLGKTTDIALPFKDIPHFPELTVPGHTGELRYVHGATGSFLHLSGRAHFYEGVPAWLLGLPVWVLSLLGVHDYVSISACGSIDDALDIGACAVISDYINVAGVNPLRGIVGADGKMEFPAMRDIADPALALAAEEAAVKAEFELGRAVYAMMPGPAYETIAELLALKTLGAGVVGMSTVPELMVARALKMRTLAIAVITNKPLITQPSHGDVVAKAGEMQPAAERWLNEFLTARESS
jgi:purine-nucleoside phosphorylase